MNLPDGHRRGLVFALTRAESAWTEISIEPEALDDQIAALHANLEDPTRPYDRTLAHTLYRALFGAPDVARLLEEKRNVVLAPQGVLLSMPFAALVTAPPADGAAGYASAAALRATRWLSADRALSITPSLSALKAQSSGAHEMRATFFGSGRPRVRRGPKQLAAD